MFAGIAAANPVDIQIFNLAGVRPGDLEEAAWVVRGIFRDAKLDVRWTTADASDVKARTDVYLVGHRTERCEARRDVVLRIVRQTPQALDHRTIGLARLDAPEGVNVTLFFDRIVDLAESYDIAVGRLLGHAAAHEIGHLLLQSGEHEDNGLMAAIWRAPEYHRIRNSMMFFDGWQRDLMQAVVRRIACREPTTAAAPATDRPGLD